MLNITPADGLVAHCYLLAIKHQNDHETISSVYIYTYTYSSDKWDLPKFLSSE
jgi:hypothetical protein